MATTAPFSALLAPKGNPRRAYDKKALEGLAQSITKDGILQNLVVKPEGKGAYRIVAGKRRYLALTFTKDLFAEKETTYFDDREQFMVLQKEAVDAKAEVLRKECAWVEVATEHTVPWWQYREAKKKRPSGAIIHLAPSGRVEVRTGLVKHEVDRGVAKQERKEKPKDRPAYSRPTLRYANAHKTLAMQMALMENPRKAKEATAASFSAARELPRYP